MNQEITQKHTVSTAINDRFIRWKELNPNISYPKK